MNAQNKHLSCPSCSSRISLLKISKGSDPIQSYPAVRPCHACGTALRYDLPKWCIPVITMYLVLMMCASFVIVNIVGLFNPAGGRQDNMPGLLLGVAITLLSLAPWVRAAPRLFKITTATPEDIAKLGGAQVV